MAKLENGFATAVLTTAALTFQVTGLTLPEIDGGELPDTTTNSNTTYRSVGIRKFLKIGNATITGAFDSDDLDAMDGILNVSDTLTVTDVAGTTYAMTVIPMKYTPGEMTEDGELVTADIEFTIVTGDTGASGITVT